MKHFREHLVWLAHWPFFISVLNGERGGREGKNLFLDSNLWNANDMKGCIFPKKIQCPWDWELTHIKYKSVHLRWIFHKPYNNRKNTKNTNKGNNGVRFPWPFIFLSNGITRANSQGSILRWSIDSQQYTVLVIIVSFVKVWQIVSCIFSKYVLLVLRVWYEVQPVYLVKVRHLM